jgi:hypothetical protein
MTYKLCLRLLELEKLTAEMLDVYYAAGRLTGEEYTDLIGMLTPAEA